MALPFLPSGETHHRPRCDVDVHVLSRRHQCKHPSSGTTQTQCTILTALVPLSSLQQRWFDTVSRKEYRGSTTVTVAAPIDFIPVYQRGGTIVPKQMRVRRSSQLMVSFCNTGVSAVSGCFCYVWYFWLLLQCLVFLVVFAMSGVPVVVPLLLQPT